MGKDIEKEIEKDIVKREQSSIENEVEKEMREIGLTKQKRKRRYKKETGIRDDIGSFFMNHPAVIGVGIIAIYLIQIYRVNPASHRLMTGMN
jgi:hypothetical protein